MVRQVVCDDKGYVLIGIFGALKSHSDDAFRGVQVGWWCYRGLRRVFFGPKSLLPKQFDATGCIARAPDLALSWPGKQYRRGYRQSVLRRRYRLGWCVQIHCGDIDRLVGAPDRQEYAVVGSTINLSARLMAAADGALLCCKVCGGLK